MSKIDKLNELVKESTIMYVNDTDPEDIVKSEITTFTNFNDVLFLLYQAILELNTKVESLTKELESLKS